MNIKKKNKFSPKDKEITDLGLGNKIFGKDHRVINRDGSFNIERKGLSFLESFSFYQWLISMSWTRFCLLIFSGYILVNLFFATLYFIGGDANFEGIETNNDFDRFINEFFFSTQTFTTVGYGRINPVGIYANIISSIESLTGLLSLALATGLLYGRFVRPLAKIIYSDNALIAPYKDITGFQFRIANKRSDHQMVDTEADVLLSRIEGDSIKFYNLKLEYRKISLFTTSWTVNHPIDEDSPLYGLTENDLKEMDSEFFVLIKGFDDTFAQLVHSRSSYKYNEIIWGAKFVNVFGRSKEGKTIIELDKISEYDRYLLPESELKKIN